MLRLVVDENVDNRILEGLRLRRQDLDVVRVQDVGLRQQEDPVVLAWAAERGRVLVTHDRATIPRFAFERVRAGLPMPGVIELRSRIMVGRAIDAILELVSGIDEGELEGQVRYLPLR